MSINKKIELTWDGKKYNLLITMRHVDEIEQDFNLTLFAYEVDAGNCKYSKLSRLLAKVLCMAGAEVTQEQVWCEIFGKGDVSPADAISMARCITSACFPEVTEETKKKPVKRRTRKK